MVIKNGKSRGQVGKNLAGVVVGGVEILIPLVACATQVQRTWGTREGNAIRVGLRLTWRPDGTQGDRVVIFYRHYVPMGREGVNQGGFLFHGRR
jgi:hypothetical protein